MIVLKIIAFYVLLFLAGNWVNLFLPKHTDKSIFHPAFLITGFVTYLLLMMLTGSIKYALFILTIIGAFNISVLLLTNQISIKITLPKISGHQYLCLFMIIFLSLMAVISPISDWDARSIWYFHAKIIYYNQGLFDSAAWSLPEFSFSHPYYPKLLPAFGGSIAYLNGQWNEYLPKIANAMLLSPYFLYLYQTKNLKNLWIVILFLPSLFNSYLWNGYADSIIAIYTSGFVISLYVYEKSKSPLDLVMSFSFLLGLLHIKNEGLALFICFFFLLLIWFRKLLQYKYIHSILALNIVTFFIWRKFISDWNLRLDMNFGINMFKNFTERLVTNKPWLILLSFLKENYVLIILAAISFYLLKRKSEITKSKVPTLIISGWFVYFGMVSYVYLSTSYDFDMHLYLSIKRVSFTFMALLTVYSFIILQHTKILKK